VVLENVLELMHSVGLALLSLCGLLFEVAVLAGRVASGVKRTSLVYLVIATLLLRWRRLPRFWLLLRLLALLVRSCLQIASFLYFVQVLLIDQHSVLVQIWSLAENARLQHQVLLVAG